MELAFYIWLYSITLLIALFVIYIYLKWLSKFNKRWLG